MTRGEELRGKIVDMAQGVSFAEIGTFLSLLNDYAAAAREEERERIMMAGRFAINPNDGKGTWVIPYAVLSPAPKETK